MFSGSLLICRVYWLTEVVSEAAECMVMWHYDCCVLFIEGENGGCSPVGKVETYRKNMCGPLNIQWVNYGPHILLFVVFSSALYWMFDYCCDVVTRWSMWTCHLLASWLDFRVRPQLALSWWPHRPSINSPTGGTICPTPKKRAIE